MRLIDIKKLKDFLASKVVMMTDYDDGIEASRIDEYIDEFVASQQPEPHWIPVTERLPETDGDYLITDDSGGVKTIEVDSFFILDDGKKMWCYSQNPVAWMELPEAYKGVTE